MSMQNFFGCEGCFFAGTKDGYRPECNCKTKRDIMELEQEKLTMEVEQPQETDNDSLFFTMKERSTAIQRRRSRRKAVKKTIRTLPIVCAKSGRLSDNASDEQVSVLNKKLSNTYDSSKFRHQVIIPFSFPEIPQNRYGRHIIHLISTFGSWEIDANFCGNSDLATSCRNAIEVLELVSRYGGEATGLHREETILYVTVGFRDKVSLSKFKGKLAS